MGVIKCGDAIELLDFVDESSVDCIYFDPPFNSNRNYFLQNGIGFSDKWEDDKYHCFLHTMLEKFYKVLKRDGNLFFHISSKDCLLPLMLCSSKFPFIQSIHWKRSRSKNNVTSKLGSCVDLIIKCSKIQKPKFNPIFQELNSSYVDKCYRHKDKRGYYALGHIVYTPSQATSNPKRLYSKEIQGIVFEPENGWRLSEEELDKLIEEDKIHVPKLATSNPYKKIYKEKSKGKLATDLWDDIHSLGQGSERRLYPTQKPKKLLERIIAMSTNKGDIVLDPTCGSGTTGIVAQEMNRSFILFDKNPQAIEITKERLTNVNNDTLLKVFPDGRFSYSELFDAFPEHSYSKKEWRAILENLNYQFIFTSKNGVKGRYWVLKEMPSLKANLLAHHKAIMSVDLSPEDRTLLLNSFEKVFFELKNKRVDSAT